MLVFTLGFMYGRAINAMLS